MVRSVWDLGDVGTTSGVVGEAKQRCGALMWHDDGCFGKCRERT